MRFEFGTVKLLDYKTQWAALGELQRKKCPAITSQLMVRGKKQKNIE
jgi:hypothetical protein